MLSIMNNVTESGGFIWKPCPTVGLVPACFDLLVQFNILISLGLRLGWMFSVYCAASLHSSLILRRSTCRHSNSSTVSIFSRLLTAWCVKCVLGSLIYRKRAVGITAYLGREGLSMPRPARILRTLATIAPVCLLE